ncbi:MAG: PAS domain S-box protein, partial [Candidatus Eisenbacteria sp.]|nr:PAS domain S-box protein [Candidatus Eisenbacteria bacterium]
MASTTFTLDSRTAARRPPVVPRISSAGAGALVALLLALATGGPAAAQDNAQDLVKIGVLAKRGPERCLEKWGLTAEYLSKPIPVVPLDIGRSFVIVPLDYDELHAAVERGEVDFVLANPSMYVELETDHGVNRLVSLRNLHGGIAYTSYAGVIFRRADRDDIKCLDDLKGKTFMAVNEESLGGWLAAWRELKEAGIDPYRDFAELQFDDTHDFVVYTVRDGLVDAGTVRSDTLERMAAEGKIRLENFRVINEQGTDILELPVQRSTRRYPEWPLAKVAHTSDELAEEVAFALLNMPADCPAAKAARCAGWTVPLNYQPVHECLKELRVGLYKDYGKVTFGDVLKQYWPWIASVAVLLAGMAVTLAWALRFLRQRKRAEAILRESEQHHRQIFEAATDGVLVFDPRGKIVEANPAACAMYGYDYDELIGLGDRDIVHRNCYHLFENFKTQLQSAGKFHAESTDVRKDGTPFEVEVRGSPVAVKGKPHLLAVVSDITERKRAEEKLRLLSQAVGNAVEGIAMGDPEYRITYVNDTFTRMFGYSREELIGRNIADVYAKAQAPQLEEALKATMEGGWMGELVGKRKNGELFPVSISSSKVLNDEGNVVAQMASHSDITERKQVEEKLRESEERYRNLISNLSNVVIMELDSEGKFT